MRETRLIVDLKAIKQNLKEIKNYIGKSVELMPIVKSYGYGSHLNLVPEILNKFNYIGTAYLSDAITIRKKGYKNNILILYPLSKNEYKLSKKYDFIINGSNIFDLVGKSDKVKIHIEIETGMGRTGLQREFIDEYIVKLNKNKNIEVDGIFTHLSTNIDKEFSLKQIELFNDSINKFNKSNIYPKKIHISSSGGLGFYKDYLYNMVRVGDLIYGYYPNDSLKGILNLKPSMKLRTYISYLKTINKKDTVGYNKIFIAKEKSVIGTIPFGYGDGFAYFKTGEHYVLVNGKKAKVIAVCMDNMMIDVTNIKDVTLGNEVYIWDNDKIKIEEVGNGTSYIRNYEVICGISERIPRVFK